MQAVTCCLDRTRDVGKLGRTQGSCPACDESHPHGGCFTGCCDACADGTKVRSNDAAAVLASMREDSMKLAAAAASGSGELLSQSPVRSGAEIVAVGAPKLACRAPPLTLTQRWQVVHMSFCLRHSYVVCMHLCGAPNLSGTPAKPSR